MLRRKFALVLALVASEAAWADLTIRYSVDMKFGAAVPAEAAATAKQQVSRLFAAGMSTRVRGPRCATSFGPLNSILDATAGEITLLSPATMQFATVPVAGYTERVLGQQSIPPEVRQAIQTLFQSLSIDAQSDKPGGTAVISGIRTEDNRTTISLGIPNPAGGPAITIRAEIHRWMPADAELSRVPQLKDMSGCMTAMGSPGDPSAAFQQLLGPLSGGSEKLGSALKELSASNGVPALKTSLDVFLTALPGLPAASSAEPTLAMDFNLAEFSTDPLPDSVFQIPEGYKSAPLEDLTKGFAAGLTQTRPAPAPQREDYTGPIERARPGSGVTNPVPIYKPEPKYDEGARKAKIEGSVVVSMVVDAEGATRNLKVVRSLDPRLDQKALEAVSTWKFTPGQKDGKPVAVAAQIEVTFRLLKPPAQQ